MKTLKEYEQIIRIKVKEMNDRDENWKWSIRSISKDRVKISWGYLKYLGCDRDHDCFIVELSDYDEDYKEYSLVSRTTDRDLIDLCSVTENDDTLSWQYSFESGIMYILKTIEYYAHSRY